MRKLLVPLAVCAALTWVLLGGCATTPITDSGRDDKAVMTGDATAGKTIYDNNCASCHELGTYDTTGSHNLSRDKNDVTASFVANHHGLSLSEADVANLRAFIASY